MSSRSGSSVKQTPPIAGRAIPRVLVDFLPLVALGVFFLSSDARFSFIDEEATLLNSAAQPVRAILGAFRAGAGAGAGQHPPLYDLLLHAWLALTGGAPALLRAPSLVFFVAGIWMLSRAALRLGGEQSATSMIWLAALWPYGFHYGRLETGYPFSFLLIAALFWAYLRHAQAPSGQAWLLVCLLAVALVWTGHLGWILLAMLGVEEWIGNRGSARKAASRLAIAAGVLVVASIPLWRMLLNSIREVVVSHPSWRAAFLMAGYKVYVLLVSESVAPWYWKFGVPGMLAVAASLALIFVAVHGQARRFFLYGTFSMALLAITGTLSAQNLLLVAPWFLLSAAVAIGTTHTSLWRRLMAVSLAVVAAVGWYGVLARIYYATPRFVEPWGDLAVEAGGVARQGGLVIGNDPSFFLYLTYALRVPPATPWRFVGSLPIVAQDRQIWAPDDWQGAGHPLGPTVLWVSGAAARSGPMDAAGEWLDRNCGDRTSRYMARDSSYVWKQRFLNAASTPWLIEVRQYSCGPNASEPPVTAPPPAESR